MFGEKSTSEVDRVLKKFLRFVLPSTVAFAFTGLYSIVDGYFVGNNVGDDGLAAINVAYPLVALINAVGTGIGMGGAVMLSIARGRGDSAAEKRYLGNTLVTLLAASVFMTALLIAVHGYLIDAFGAEGRVNDFADTYIFVLAAFAAVQIFSTGCVPLLRNFGASFGAMAAMAAGFVTNIILDWLLVQHIPKGIFGAALATGLGQVVTVLPCLIYLVVKVKKLGKGVFKVRPRETLDILRVGASPFGSLLCPQVIVVILNKFLFDYGSSLHVAAYSVIMYVYCVDLLLLQGVGDGAQPLISFVKGEGDRASALKLRNYAYVTSLLLAGAGCLVLCLMREIIPEVFGAGEFASAESARILPLFAVSALFTAVGKVTASYYYSMDRNFGAYLIVYGEVAVILLLVLILPPTFGIDGVWWSQPLAQAIIALVSAALLADMYLRRNRYPDRPEYYRDGGRALPADERDGQSGKCGV